LRTRSLKGEGKNLGFRIDTIWLSKGIPGPLFSAEISLHRFLGLWYRKSKEEREDFSLAIQIGREQKVMESREEVFCGAGKGFAP